VKRYQDFQALDVRIIAISVDPPDKAKFLQEKLHAPFSILSDSQDEAMDRYGTRSPQYKSRAGAVLNTPTLILMDKSHRIRWIHQATNYRVRENVEEDLAEAGKLKK
jgi:peroxiredoxin